jgi:hypothetical protein
VTNKLNPFLSRFSKYRDSYVELWEQDYKYILHGLRAAVALLPAFVLFVFSSNMVFLWMGVCSFVWAIHMAIVDKVFFLRYFTVSIVLSILILIGFFSKSHIFLFCIYCFLISFFPFVFLYYKKSYLYAIAIPQYGSLAVTSLRSAFEHALCAVLGFLFTYLSFRFLIKKDVNIEITHMVHSGYFKLEEYMDRVKSYMQTRTIDNYRKLSKDRLLLFEFLQALRLFTKEESAVLNSKNLVYAGFQERFIELCIWVGIRFRTVQIEPDEWEGLEHFFSLIVKCIQDLKELMDTESVVEHCQKESDYFLKAHVQDDVREVYVQFYQNIILIEKEFHLK